MAFSGKVYTFVRHENFDSFLRSIGLSDEKIQVVVNSSPTETLVQDGDSYTLSVTSPTGDRTITFKSGVEIDELIGTGDTVKSTYTVDGNTVTQVIKGGRGTTTFIKEYNGDELVVTVTSDSFDGVAKRYYKA